jgi:urease accessory protein
MRHRLTAALALTLVPTAALAHPGIGDTHGFVQGFAHPLGGLLAMAAGGALAMLGAAVPLVELGIALSVIVLGAVVALGVKAPLATAMGLVGLFAIFHGHAHGTEMPLDASGGAYGAGFMLATALLHVAGIALGVAIGRIGDAYGRAAYRLGGAFVVLAGVALFTHAL